MRNCYFLAFFIAVILFLDLLLVNNMYVKRREYSKDIALMNLMVKELGLSDLAAATEARYTRHPAVSDGVVPFMDHPGDIEHFPTGSFWRPVE